MAFDPLDWLAVARRLAENADEGSRRTAVGRAYYAVFLRTRVWLEEAGRLQPTRRARDHRAVTEYLKQSPWPSAADALADLYERRTAADYERAVEVASADSIRALELAEEVQLHLQSEWDLHPLT